MAQAGRPPPPGAVALPWRFSLGAGRWRGLAGPERRGARGPVARPDADPARRRPRWPIPRLLPPPRRLRLAPPLLPSTPRFRRRREAAPGAGWSRWRGRWRGTAAASLAPGAGRSSSSTWAALGERGCGGGGRRGTGPGPYRPVAERGSAEGGRWEPRSEGPDLPGSPRGALPGCRSVSPGTCPPGLRGLDMVPPPGRLNKDSLSVLQGSWARSTWRQVWGGSAVLRGVCLQCLGSVAVYFSSAFYGLSGDTAASGQLCFAIRSICF